MKKYLRHLLIALFSFLFILVLNFSLPRFLPGDPIGYLTGFEEAQMDPFVYESYYHALHLDENLFVQFGYYLGSLFDGTLGYSFKKECTVASLIRGKILYSLQITLPATLISLSLGLFLGLHAGYKKNSIFDRVSTTSLIILDCMPSFMIALLLMILFCFQSEIFPYMGLNDPEAAEGTFAYFLDRLHHLSLPVLSLVLATLPSRFLLVRNTSASFKNDKSILYSRQRGFSSFQIETKYMMKNIIQPFITMAGTSIGAAFAGSIVIENIFSIPGIGSLLNQAIHTLDYPLIQGILFVTSFFMILCVVLSDILCILIDPKVKKEGRA